MAPGLLANQAVVLAAAAARQPAALAARAAIATFVLARSRSADLNDLLWGADGANPRNGASHVVAAQHGASPQAGAAAAAAAARDRRAAAAVRAGAAMSTRDAVARCASRLAFSLHPGTPTSYAGALGHSSQARVVTEPTFPFRIVHVNRAWEQLCGWRASEVVGRTMAILQGADTDPAVLGQVRAAALSAARTQVSCVNYRKDGSRFVNRLQVSPLYDRSGNVSHLLGVLQEAPEDAWRLRTPATRASAQRTASEGLEAAGDGGSGGRDGAAAAAAGP